MPRCHSLANRDHFRIYRFQTGTKIPNRNPSSNYGSEPRSKIPARNPSPWLQIPGTKRPGYFTSMSSYSLVPRPIFSPCSIMERQLVSGCVMLR